MVRVKDYLELFQLPESYSLEQLKKAYYAQAQLWHPDRFADREEREIASLEFQKLQDAYAFLQKLLDERRQSQETFLSLKQKMAVAKDSRSDFTRFAGKELDPSLNQGLLCNVFGLDCTAFSLLLSLLNCLYEEDMANVYEPIWDFPEHFEGDLDEKKTWYVSWQDAIRQACFHREPKRRPTIWVDRSKEYQSALKTVSNGSSPFLGHLLALEVATFDLYWPLPEDPDQIFQWFTIEPEFLQRFYAHHFQPLGFPAAFVGGLRESVLNSMQRLYPDWKNLHREVFRRGDGTLFGAALGARRDLVLTPAGRRPRNSSMEPEGVALAGAGLRVWLDEPQLQVIAGGGSLLTPFCGDGTMCTGKWSLGEVLGSLAKLEIFLEKVVCPDKTYGFCSSHVLHLLRKWRGHLEEIHCEAGAEQREKIVLIRSWADQILARFERN